MTPEQLRIYNSHRLKRGLTPLKDDSDVTTFTSEYSNVLPYITGLQTETDDPEYAKNIKQELDWISNSTHYLFDAVDAGVQAYQEAIAAGKTAQEAIEDAAQAASDANQAAIDAQNAANKAQQGVDAANQAIATANDAIGKVAQAQADATNALNEAGAAGDTAAEAITNANNAYTKAQDAQDQAIAANTAAANAAAAAAAAACKCTILNPGGHTATSAGTNFINVPASTVTQNLILLGYFAFNPAGQRSYLQFHMGGNVLQFSVPTQGGWITQWDTDNEGKNPLRCAGLTIQIPAGWGGPIAVVDTANRNASFSIAGSYSAGDGTAYSPCVALLTQATGDFYPM